MERRRGRDVQKVTKGGLEMSDEMRRGLGLETSLVIFKNFFKLVF